MACYSCPQIRGVEVGIVVIVLMVWAGAIALFFNRWGKIRMLLPYQPDYKQEQLKVPGTGVCSSGACNGQHSHQVNSHPVDPLPTWRTHWTTPDVWIVWRGDELRSYKMILTWTIRQLTLKWLVNALNVFAAVDVAAAYTDMVVGEEDDKIVGTGW